MTSAIVDSTVIIHLFRHNPTALTWFANQAEKLSVTTITWLEVMYGAPGKGGQIACEQWLDRFEKLYLMPSDQDWAMEQMRKYRLSRGIEIEDCLIASIGYRLQVSLYTHNIKDMRKLLPSAQVIQPY